MAESPKLQFVDRMTDRSQKVLALALREALQLGHAYAGPEHILLAILREGTNVAAKSLEALGLDYNKMRPIVMKMFLREPTLEERVQKLEELIAETDDKATG